MTDLTWLSTRELAHLIASGEVSSTEAVKAHFARIEQVNPTINAIVTLNPERALDEARRADEKTVAARAAGESLPPLHGVPMTIKDTHDTAGMRTTLGSPIYADRVPDSDDLLVARLRAAGIIPTGKSNVPEFAAGAHTFNPVFGTTVNPYDPTKSVAGSSGGVAAALATGIQASGDGSDMGGSLRTPASFNNVVGMRPSNGRIPHTPPGNAWQWLAQQGFMGRTVGDVALLMSVGAGPDPAGPCSIQEPGGVFDLPEFALGSSHAPSVAGVKVGLSPTLDGLMEVERDVQLAVTAAADVFSRLGADVDDRIPDLRDADQVFSVQRAYDFAASWGDLVRAETARPDGGRIKQAVVWNTQLGLDLTVQDLAAMDEARGRLWQATQRYFATHDVLVMPTAQALPFDAELEYPQAINGRPMANYLEWMRAVTLISATGCPAISVPGGFSSDGLPIGIQIVAAPGKDVELLRVAAAFEAATRYADRHPPL
ncbi:amidase [Kineosphaera limosa]|uniref:Putative amidase n=1 Tax=Kineosphaera limosa NBRC 100340 TaxID=1184609 RepID=K6WB46_9MICO|nr:amidase family protein [Kineosphaera limosa]NYE01752.1 amidase [Kineosphaera limosa]GAB96450.1 putative amidase [Kineosphaera limosa NBRC 100340]